MTKGKMFLELLIYAKSAKKKFDQSEASFESHMTTCPFSHLRVLVQRFPKWYDKCRWAQKWALQGQFKILTDF